MVTFSVTIDEESHKELFLRLMEELKFVVSVRPEKKSAKLNVLELVLPGKGITDKGLEELIVLAESEETYEHQQSKKANTQLLKKWQEKANK